MVPEQRRRQLIDHLRERGAVDVAKVAPGAGTAASTVRRDLQVFEEQGWLQRTHGGAALPEHCASFELPYAEKLGRTAPGGAPPALAGQRYAGTSS
jgi:DeoR family transcriptional regulator, aga operon transcriptional repressor